MKYQVDALDFSQEMLNLAKEKSLYRNYFCDSIRPKEKTEIDDGKIKSLNIMYILQSGGYNAHAIKGTNCLQKDIGGRPCLMQLSTWFQVSD